METLLLSIIQTYWLNSFAFFTLPLNHYNLLLAVSSAGNRSKRRAITGQITVAHWGCRSPCNYQFLNVNTLCNLFFLTYKYFVLHLVMKGAQSLLVGAGVGFIESCCVPTIIFYTYTIALLFILLVYWQLKGNYISSKIRKVLSKKFVLKLRRSSKQC